MVIWNDDTCCGKVKLALVRLIWRNGFFEPGGGIQSYPDRYNGRGVNKIRFEKPVIQDNICYLHLHVLSLKLNCPGRQTSREAVAPAAVGPCRWLLEWGRYSEEGEMGWIVPALLCSGTQHWTLVVSFWQSNFCNFEHLCSFCSAGSCSQSCSSDKFAL